MYIEPSLQNAGRTRKDLVGCRGRENDQVDLLRIDTSRVDRAARRVLGEIYRGFVVPGDMTLFDTGTLPNPLVRGVDKLFQLMVGHDLLRQVAAGAGDTAVDHENAASI